MRHRPPERVEVIDSDPHAFGRSGLDRKPPTTARRRPLVPVAVAVVVLAAVVVWWPRSSDEPDTLPTTTVPTPVAVAAPGGRPAPEPATGVAFGLLAEPGAVSAGVAVALQLSGDLAGVPDRVAAVAWLDTFTEGEWRTVYWMARSSDFVQEVRPVSDDHPEPGPDAVMIPAAESMEFFANGIVPGSYRVCRFVPLRPDPVSNLPTDPVYLCAPLVVAS